MTEPIGEPVDDFARYSEGVVFPEGASEEEVKHWFDDVYREWCSYRWIYTSSGLLKAFKELAKRGWSFVLTLDETFRHESVEGNVISAQCMGYATKQSPFYISISRDYLALGKHDRGWIASFAPDEIPGLQAVAPD